MLLPQHYMPCKLHVYSIVGLYRGRKPSVRWQVMQIFLSK